ncbi:hypothetical protein [Methylobacterium fujisawaense]
MNLSAFAFATGPSPAPATTRPSRTTCWRRRRRGRAPPPAIGGETDPERYVAIRAALLHERLTAVADLAARDALDGVEIEEGELFIARARPAVPDEARLWADRLYGMLPRVRVTKVMADVERATGFAACFTHLRTGSPVRCPASPP